MFQAITALGAQGRARLQGYADVCVRDVTDDEDGDVMFFKFNV